MDPVTAIFILILFFGLLRKRKGKQAVVEQTVMPTGIYPYEKKEFLLSGEEAGFYQLLHSIVGGKFRICMKVDMEALIDVKKNISASARQGYLKRVNQQYADFVLCREQDLRVICVILLDKKGAASEAQAEEDRFMDQAFKAASLPLIRFKLSAAYNQKAIVAALKKGINDALKPAEEQQTEAKVASQNG